MDERDSLRIARMKQGWNQADLAQICGVTSVTISHLETGKHQPKEKTRKKIESILGTIDWRATREEAIIRNN